jgi:hypothetical protein
VKESGNLPACLCIIYLTAGGKSAREEENLPAILLTLNIFNENGHYSDIGW